MTEQGWTDYVFDPNYKLRSLSSLKIFIEKNKHLPDVPSVLGVEKNGIDEGATQAALLRKIEELVLYIIEQGKELKDQKKEIGLLRKQVEKIKKEISYCT